MASFPCPRVEMIELSNATFCTYHTEYEHDEELGGRFENSKHANDEDETRAKENFVPDVA